VTDFDEVGQSVLESCHLMALLQLSPFGVEPCTLQDGCGDELALAALVPALPLDGYTEALQPADDFQGLVVDAVGALLGLEGLNHQHVILQIANVSLPEILKTLQAVRDDERDPDDFCVRVVQAHSTLGSRINRQHPHFKPFQLTGRPG
jgi:hypothetical protein